MTGIHAEVEPARLAPEALATYVRERLEERVTDELIAHGQLTVTVRPDALPMAARLCHDDPALAFDFFDFLTAVDEREDGFAIIVHLYSTRHRHHIQIRTIAAGGREAPNVPTISHLYAGADWHERETYDMFGITFEGHPGLLPRILTVENFEGFPLRKEFLLMTREVKPWPGLKEPKEADAGEGEGAGDAGPTGPSAEEKARMAREKAERAKAKAAEARKRRAREQAEAVGGAASAAETRTPPGDGEASPEKDAESAPPPEQTPSPADLEDVDVTDEIRPIPQGDDGGAGLPPRGPGEEEPRALSDDGVAAVPLADEGDAEVTGTIADRPDQERPMGTDADDRFRRLEDDEESP